MNNNILNQAIDVMKQGGKDICEKAKDKWDSETYYPNFTREDRKIHYNEWEKTSQAISILISYINENKESIFANL
jgi:hypothetical protein